MGQLGSTFGIGPNAAAKGMNWSPTSANIQTPVTSDQAYQAMLASQSGIAGQQAFMQALQAQNGIGNQSSVFNQLQGVANGTGPNPAQAMLAQSTGANTANQAALMAGQRGAGANTGLIARQASQQGAANQQNSIGQGAMLQAQQSLGALGQLGGIAGQQVGQQANATNALAGSQQSEQQLLLNSIAAQNNAAVGAQGQMNSANLSQAQLGAKSQPGLAQGASILSSLNKGGEVSNKPHYAYGTQSGAVMQPSLGVDTQLPTSSLNQQSYAQNPAQASAQPNAAQRVLGQISQWGNEGQADSSQGDGYAAIGKGIAGLAGGIKNLFSSSSSTGGAADSASGKAADNAETASDSFLKSSNDTDDGSDKKMGAGAVAKVAELLHKGGAVPAMVSPGERYLSPKEVEKVAKGEKAAAKAGEKIPGKAKVKGDSLKNDTVPKTLEEGGIVLPKSVMESKHPHWEAHKFVSAILAKNKGLKR